MMFIAPLDEGHLPIDEANQWQRRPVQVCRRIRIFFGCTRWAGVGRGGDCAQGRQRASATRPSRSSQTPKSQLTGLEQQADAIAKSLASLQEQSGAAAKNVADLKQMVPGVLQENQGVGECL
jgi:hypothetical protein